MSPKKQKIVEMKDISMSFSGVQVLSSVDFDLFEGEIHSIIGANGAGKSTLIKILNGIYQPVGGNIFINQKEEFIKNPGQVEKLGLSFVHQELNICNDMTVSENLFIGNWKTNKLGLYDRKATVAATAELLKVMGVDLNPNDPVRNLRAAEKQTIEILKTLTRKTKVIVMDEPTSSLNEKEKLNFFKIISRLKESGVSIVFISHFLEDIIEISDRVTAIKDGKRNGVFIRGSYSKEDLITAMMGKKIPAAPVNLELNPGAPTILELKGLGSAKKFNNISFSIKKGEIVGVCGLLAAGKTELARAIFGLDSYDRGEIIYCGEKLKRSRPSEIVRKKIALLTEERKAEGFIPLLPIMENITLSVPQKISAGNLLINKNTQKSIALGLAEKVTVKMTDIYQNVKSLSGGNQQKVVIAKCLASDPKLFMLDEPTRGVDVHAKYEIYQILKRSARDGTAVIIFSSELEELLENCGRIFVLKKGELSAEVPAASTTKNDLIDLIS